MRIEEFQSKLDPKNIFGSIAFRKQGRTELGTRVSALESELKRWDGYVRGRQYLTGDQFTLADIALFPLLMHCEALGFRFEQETPALAAYLSACKERPSVVQSVWVENFGAFVRKLNVAPVLAADNTRLP